MRVMYRGPSVIGVLLVAGWLVAASKAPSAAPAQAARGGPPVRVQLPPQGATEGYVGEDRCRSCHRAEMTQYRKTGHAGVVSAETRQRMTCEIWHGAGKAHVDAVEAAKGEEPATSQAARLIFAFKGTPRENAARCQSCHVTARGRENFEHSSHLAVGVSCHSCHSSHLVEAAYRDRLRKPPLPAAELFQVPPPEMEHQWLADSQLKATQPELCFGCHTQIRAQFALPFHHRVPEGSMTCTDCHNPHGTWNRASLVAPGSETCASCHQDKRGPFLFEHAAVKVEGCAVCHSPHGAASRFMLNRRESRFLCLQCHGDPHAAQDQISVPHSRFGFQTRGDCTRCHITIHGSNHNRQFLH